MVEKAAVGCLQRGDWGLHPISKQLIGTIQAKVALHNLYQSWIVYYDMGFECLKISLGGTKGSLGEL